MTSAEFDQWLINPRRRHLIMGVLNVTPDSFSDGGRFDVVEAAVARFRQMADEGADLVDLGAESTRPGALPIAEAEQIARLTPVLRAFNGQLPTVCSIDTTKAAVAKAAIELGANIVNDISAGRDNPAMFEFCAATGCAIVLMHMQGTPETMQRDPHYDDVVREVHGFLRERSQAAAQAGIEEHRILIDPGIGFGKTAADNLTLLRQLRPFAQMGRPVVVGASRKGFIGQLTDEPVAAKRQFGTAAAVAWSAANGASISRVHDVREMRQVVRVVEAIQRNVG